MTWHDVVVEKSPEEEEISSQGRSGRRKKGRTKDIEIKKI